MPVCTLIPIRVLACPLPVMGIRMFWYQHIYIICGYQTSHHQAIWHKTLLGKRLPRLVDVVYQCIVVLSVTLHYFLGDQVSMHPHEAG
jgi:hypothetical protein